jgi:hypothetical protein
MGQTRYYDLAFFDFGDRLDEGINVQKEINRFVVIDKQIYGMYKIFGNGVIEGFTVSDGGFQETNGIAVTISQGLGVINYWAAQTEIPGNVYNLPPNTVVDIYATISGTTHIDRAVNFIYSTTPLGIEGIRLATVSTGGNSILYIDNTTRELIGFEQIIKDAIDQHKHRGTPSKIDLSTETRNQLSGARLEGIDASKVVSGRFNIERMSLVDHNELENNGLITHAALDSFIKTFSQSNKELLGEISSVNLLKAIIFWKYKFSNVDEFFINELALIPGISPNDFIDFDNSTAHISLVDKCISGLPTELVQTGTFTSVLWNDTFSFNTAVVQSNVVIDDDKASLARASVVRESIADFDDTLNGNLILTPETLIIDNDQSVVIDTEDGNRFAKLGYGATLEYFYRRNFLEGKNWDGTYDELTIKVKTNEAIHGPVYMYLINGSNKNSSGQFGSLEVGDIVEEGVDKKKPSSSWEIISENETMSEFVEKVFDISSLGLTDVTQITIHTLDDFIFDIDDIEVRKTNMFSDSGTLRFDYNTETSLVFHSVFYDATTPEDTGISVRLKVASASDLLPRASYSLPLNSGDVFATTGSVAELEVVMTSNTTRNLSPILNSLELRLLVVADSTGFVIDTEDEWERGTLTNTSILDSSVPDKSILNISTPINVGGRYFAKNSSISEINDEDVGLYGFSGNLMPISPNQAREWNVSSSRGFSTVPSVIRRFDNSFLIADLGNNRVLQVDNDGSLIKGFGSTYSIDTNFYPLSAAYSPTTKTLTIVFTMAAVVEDITKIALFVGPTQILLSAEDTVLSNSTTPPKTTVDNKILEILLDDDTAVRLVGATSDNLSVNFYGGAFTATIEENSGMSAQGNSIFSPLKGLVCFVGEFTYIDNIRHPVFAGETSEDNWIIANSSIPYEDIDPLKEDDDADVPDIIEIDPEDITNTENKLIFSGIKFSDYTLGGIHEYEDDRFVVSGLEAYSNTLSGITGDQLLDQHGGATLAPESVKFRAKGIEDLGGYAGRVFVLDKINGRKQVLYSSPDGLYPSDIGEYSNGDFVVSESSVANASGRIIRIDSYGNITWTWGQGSMAIINDVNTLSDDKLIVSV